jgi:two-component system, OmpR family, sensor kinase
VTLAFAGVMAIVLGGIGLFVYLRFERELEASIDERLRSRAADLSGLVREAEFEPSETRSAPVGDGAEDFAQVLEANGRVVDGTARLRDRSLLNDDELARAQTAPITVEREHQLDPGETARLLAVPVSVQGKRVVAVVGTSLGDKTDAVKSLVALLLIGGPIALLLASLAGYGVAGAALKPVEAMRRRASQIGDADSRQRLPIGEADDEIKRLGETLNAMLARLEATFARERAFVSDASHELRTPLAILKAELELALRGDRSRDELYGALRSAAEETERVVRLAEDLLVIARSDQGQLPVRLESWDAEDLLTDITEAFARRSEEEGRDFEVEAKPGLRLTADRLRLEQALGNMLDNALRHGAGTIRLSTEERSGRAYLCVSDEGNGFPSDFLEHAFERFTRADEARSRGGSGLGLALVEAIARAHGGEAGARNRAGRGAEVWIALPSPVALRDTRSPGAAAAWP